jgi:heat shock protein HslJ
MASKSVTQLGIIVATVAMLAACAAPPAPPPKSTDTSAPAQTQPAANPLAGTDWLLETLGGNAPVPNTQITLSFVSEGQVAGSDGCNRFTGPYTVDGANLKLGPLGGTMMACSEPIMQQANVFSRVLAETRTFAIANARLSLIDSSNATLAVFAAQSSALAGTKWDVTSINNGKQAVVGVIEGTTLTVAFGEDGTVSGSAGCNNFTGGFTQTDKTVAIGPLASTMKMCTEPAGVMEQETQFVKALESAATVQPDGDMLTLRTKEDAMAVVLRRAP